MARDLCKPFGYKSHFELAYGVYLVALYVQDPFVLDGMTRGRYSLDELIGAFGFE